MIFAGSASRKLTEAICSELGVPVRKSTYRKFSDQNTFVQIDESVRGQDVFIVQSTIHTANDTFMELLFWIDAFKRASASSVTAVIPYFSYGKGDKKDEPRVSIRARVCADCLEAAGCDRVVSMDLHSPQIQGFFRIPVDNLFGRHTLGEHILSEAGRDLVIVAADTGFADQARHFSRLLGVPVAFSLKHRPDHGEQAEVVDIIGQVEGKTALIVDDFVISGGTLISGAANLRQKGAKRVLAAVTHGIFSPGAVDRINSSQLEALYITDSVENHPEPLNSKIRTVSVAPCFAEAIRRISSNESLGEMFPG